MEIVTCELGWLATAYAQFPAVVGTSTLSKQETNQGRIELSSCLLWSIWKMRNQLCFNNVEISAWEVVEMAVKEWAEFKESTERQRMMQQGQHQENRAREEGQQRQPCVVGYQVIETSYTNQREPPESTMGILVKDHNGIIQHAQAKVRNGTKSSKLLALENVRDAQVLAYQLGLNKIII